MSAKLHVGRAKFPLLQVASVAAYSRRIVLKIERVPEPVMTTHQRNFPSIDPEKLDRLAEIAVKVGLRLQPGQDLFLTAPVAALPLARRIAERRLQGGRGAGDADLLR